MALSGIVAVAAGYVAAIVGAGFVSGREILVFFISPGPSLLGIAGTAVLFAFFGVVITDLCARWDVHSYSGLLVRALGTAAPLADIALGLFVFVTFCAVEAGGGELARTVTGLPVLPSSAMWGLLAAGALTFTGDRLRTIQSVLVGVLLAALGLAFLAVPGGGAPWPRAVADAFGSHVLYVGYNVMLAAAALPALVGRASHAAARRLGAIVGGVALSVAIYVIADVVQRGGPRAASHPLPAWSAAAGGPPWLAAALAVAIAAATAGALLSYLTALSTRYPALRTVRLLAMLWAASVAVSASGIVAIVGTAYPIMGFVSCAFLAAFVVRWVSGG